MQRLKRAFPGRSVELFDEDGAQPRQPIHHMPIVNNFVAHIDRRAPLLNRALDDLNGPVHARAEPARRCKQDGEWRFWRVNHVGL